MIPYIRTYCQYILDLLKYTWWLFGLFKNRHTWQFNVRKLSRDWAVSTTYFFQCVMVHSVVILDSSFFLYKSNSSFFLVDYSFEAVVECFVVWVKFHECNNIMLALVCFRKVWKRLLWEAVLGFFLDNQVVRHGRLLTMRKETEATQEPIKRKNYGV